MTDQEKNQIREYQLNGLEPKKISELMGLPHNTIKVHCYRHPVTKAEISDHKGVCRYCGKLLLHTPKKKRKHYCSDNCRMAWWKDNNAKLNKKAFYHIICQHCGSEFVSYGNAKRKFCSRSCYAQSRKKVAHDA